MVHKQEYKKVEYHQKPADQSKNPVLTHPVKDKRLQCLDFLRT